jgi:uncharacterized protein involved in exopolysaccharide biosynthesis
VIGAVGDADAPQRAARRGNRRRLAVFVVTFLVVLALGQAWNFARPAEYRSSTRLQLDLPDAGGADVVASNALANRVQFVTSTPVLTRLVDELRAADGGGGDAPSVEALRAGVEVQPVPGSEVVQLSATGADAALLARTLNAMPAALHAELAARQAGEADARLAVARQELARLETRAQERRERLERFRQRSGLLAEREDNDAIARHKGLSASLNAAIDKEAAAAARLRALTEAAAQGKAPTGGRQDAVLAGLEGKVGQLREELREVERTYTPEFMAIDPKVRASRTRLAELERQIAEQREQFARGTLQAAQEDLNTAQAQVARLRDSQAAVRSAVGTVSTRLGEAKVIEEDLAQIEKTRRTLLERVARLESNEQRRVAGVSVLEPALMAAAPFRPDRLGDGLWVGAGALAAATLVMLLVEAFNRPPVQVPLAPVANTLVLGPDWPRPPALGGSAHPGLLPAAAAMTRLGAPAMAAAQPGGADTMPAIAAPLTQPEALALLTAAQGCTRMACALGLMGLTAAEAQAVVAADVDGVQLQLRGAWARVLPLPPWLATACAGRPAAQPLLCNAAGLALDADDLRGMLVGAALDAGLADAARLTWDRLRLTAIAALLDQGLRYAELPALVGRVDADQLAALAARTSEAPRRSAGEVEPLMAALRVAPG